MVPYPLQRDLGDQQGKDFFIFGMFFRPPIVPTIPFKYGISTTHMKGKASPVIISSDFGLGRIEIVKNDSTLMVYNLEIAFVNMLKPTYDTDFEQ